MGSPERSENPLEPAAGRRGVKPSGARGPYAADAIFFETIVQVYFFSIVQWARFWIWLGGEL